MIHHVKKQRYPKHFKAIVCVTPQHREIMHVLNLFEIIPDCDFIIMKKKQDLYDIYVCSAIIQSGLGLIYSALFYGLVIFLDGANYQWVVKMGCHVRHIDELQAFLQPPQSLTALQKEKNMRCVLKTIDSMDKWNDLFAEISK